MSAIDRIVRRLIDDQTVDLEPGPLYEAAVAVAATEAPLIDGAAVEAVHALVGLGPVESLLAEPGVTDVLINGPNDVWVERNGILESSPVRFGDASRVVQAVRRVLAPLGLRFDPGSPTVAARLSDGSRLHAAMPPACVGGPIVAVRRFVPVVSTLSDLVDAGALVPATARFLAEEVRVMSNILVAGATGAGKTTLLNVLGSEIGPSERVVTIEDAAELQIPGHVVRLEARPPNAEGAGEITIESLVRTALRLRPDRIIVGEVRGPEALDLIQAMSTGHNGSMGTVHANGPDEAMWRLETLALRGDGARSAEAVRRQLWSAIDLIVFVERTPELGRRVSTVHRVGSSATEEVAAC